MTKIYYTLTIAIGLLFLVNCSPKVKPTSSSQAGAASKSESNEAGAFKENPAAKSFASMSVEEKIASATSLKDDEYASGLSLYQAKCSQCHKAYDPNKRDMGGWLKILVPMSSKAKLKDDEYKLIAGYLLNNCRK